MPVLVVAAIRSALYVALMTLTVIPYAVFTLLLWPMPLHWRFRLTLGWPRWAVWAARWMCGIHWRVEGWENLPSGPAVLLAKHQAAWETLFLIAHMPRETAFVYKRELHALPFFGWGLAALKMISIDRNRQMDAFEQMVEQGARKLAEGRWIVIFPEGTRTLPGAAPRYGSGGARLAIRTGTLTVPIALNSGEYWPRHSFVKTPGVITVRIGKPISPEGKSAKQLAASVESWIETQMREIAPHRYTAAYRGKLASQSAAAAATATSVRAAPRESQSSHPPGLA